jgi:hypothetical protein
VSDRARATAMVGRPSMTGPARRDRGEGVQQDEV